MPDLSQLLESHGEGWVLATGGLVIGVLFGFFAQRSKFCLRAAVIEFWHGQFGEKLPVWLLAFASAVVAVQALTLAGWLDVKTARQMANTGSLSGALVGGALFGVGMILTRGCASRLLVLSATGNLRALLSGLIFAVAAQASLGGALAPLRLGISGWWTIDGGSARDLLVWTGAGHWGGLAFGGAWLLAGIYFAVRNRWRPLKWVMAICTGLTVALAWWFSYQVSQSSFEVINVQGLTFSGPSAEWLMRVLASPAPAVGFDFGLMPGVFAGSFLGALLGREWKLEGFKDGHSMRRYILGATLMGFGAMLAGGCAVGAGITGGAIFAVTAWLSLLGMWAGAGITDRLIDAAPTPLPATR
jgi:uncharacterized membrane protein YedE/YeeE